MNIKNCISHTNKYVIWAIYLITYLENHKYFSAPANNSDSIREWQQELKWDQA